ncbi:MAG: amino acid decarboxylase, partial [Clostridia bacterium]|nr:amino acid decarboxylase [Clostridia bacterium]
MNTPICEFLEDYAKKGATRLHMPGHKGMGKVEKYDLTEIDGADSLYEADGIIAESERNAGALFGAHTFYSAEGSSLAIRAMLYLTSLYAACRGQKPLVLAGRNAHKTFVSAVAMLGTEVEWLTGEGSYLSCRVTAEAVRGYFARAERLPTAVYLTSPDYLGNMADIAGVARVCRENGVLLLVDNAHGAYLRFLPEPMHPMELGAHMCSDSAHKTLPALTGCAYLHVAKDAPPVLAENAKNALALFGSTSPSYLLL